MLRQYETTFIVDAHLPGEQIDATIDKLTKFIDGSGGKVKLVDRWGKRRLAYEIRRRQYGYYVYVRFESEGSFVKELEREFKLNDSIVRFLTVAVPKAVLSEEMTGKPQQVSEGSHSDVLNNTDEPEEFFQKTDRAPEDHSDEKVPSE